MLYFFLTVLFIYNCSNVSEISVVFLKSLSTFDLIESREFFIIYTIFNIGEKDIINVVLRDNPLPKELFHTPSHSSFTWVRIPAKSQVSVSLPIVPKYGDFVSNFTSAAVTYNVIGEKETIVARSNELGQAMIQNLDDYLRLNSSHLLWWFYVALIFVPCILIPYVQWKNAKYIYKIPKNHKTKSE